MTADARRPRLLTVSALAAFTWGCMVFPAYAGPRAPGNHDHHGNGRHNRNVFTSRSPTHNRGYQHTNNGNAGGQNPVQNALCRDSTVCNVTQKVIIVEPSSPPSSPDTTPESAPGAAVRPLEAKPPSAPPAQPPASRPTGPFMYMGRDGFMMSSGADLPFSFGLSPIRGGLIPFF